MKVEFLQPGKDRWIVEGISKIFGLSFHAFLLETSATSGIPESSGMANEKAFRDVVNSQFALFFNGGHGEKIRGEVQKSSGMEDTFKKGRIPLDFILPYFNPPLQQVLSEQGGLKESVISSHSEGLRKRDFQGNKALNILQTSGIWQSPSLSCEERTDISGFNKKFIPEFPSFGVVENEDIVSLDDTLIKISTAPEGNTKVELRDPLSVFSLEHQLSDSLESQVVIGGKDTLFKKRSSFRDLERETAVRILSSESVELQSSGQGIKDIIKVTPGLDARIEKIERFNSYFEKDIQGIKVSLEPEGFGRIEIVLNTQKGIIKGYINAFELYSKEVIERNLWDIISILQRDGINIGSLTVGYGREYRYEGGKRGGDYRIQDESGEDKIESISPLPVYQNPVRGLSIFV